MAGKDESVASRLALLEQQVASMRESLTALDVEQKRRTATLLESSQKALEKHALLETRLGSLEQDHEAVARLSRHGLESLSTRVTELGVEIAEFPSAQEVLETVQALPSFFGALGSVKEETYGRLGTLEGLMEDLRNKGEESRAFLQALHKDLESCRQELQGLSWHLGGTCAKSGAEGGAQPMPSLVGRVQVLEEIHASLAKELPQKATSAELAELLKASSLQSAEKLRLTASELREEQRANTAAIFEQLGHKVDRSEMMQLMAPRNHTHDRLVSVDGSVTFAL